MHWNFSRAIKAQQQFYEEYLQQDDVEVGLGVLVDNIAIALLCYEPLLQGRKRLVNFMEHP